MSIQSIINGLNVKFNNDVQKLLNYCNSIIKSIRNSKMSIANKNNHYTDNMQITELPNFQDVPTEIWPQYLLEQIDNTVKNLSTNVKEFTTSKFLIAESDTDFSFLSILILEKEFGSSSLTYFCISS